ncbi:CRISPR-associated RAMP Cmr5 [hydrothermal vent metagenome]|uniref:CRISPR type III-B/RAMP module-associated protein Cmr5 n=1 Tax=hydrothermal vent metagenome TaxID=652676 RepID=A0A1W1E4L2_9ZZZZ
MKTIQQQRAEFALGEIKAFLNSNPSPSDKQQKEYKSYASGLPAMIHTNGLGQAAAFYKSKGGTHEELYQLLSDWLTKDTQPFAEKTDLLEGITTSNMQTYQFAQAEAQALMDWVKKFAKAYMGGED